MGRIGIGLNSYWGAQAAKRKIRREAKNKFWAISDLDLAFMGKIFLIKKL
jgi:hypothetical protein